jgi:hypothetical protein
LATANYLPDQAVTWSTGKPRPGLHTDRGFA